MKRFLGILLSFLLIVPLIGCENASDPDAVLFYYSRKEFQYHSADSVIVAEEREISNPSRDLGYLLPLYLVGPLDESLVSPFPAGTRLERVSLGNDTLTLELSDLDGILTDPQFSLACGCIALTGFEYCQSDSITVISGQRTIQIDRDSLILSDIPVSNSETTEAQS